MAVAGQAQQRDKRSQPSELEASVTAARFLFCSSNDDTLFLLDTAQRQLQRFQEGPAGTTKVWRHSLL